jgi:hypothetical protein
MIMLGKKMSDTTLRMGKKEYSSEVEQIFIFHDYGNTI